MHPSLLLKVDLLIVPWRRHDIILNKSVVLQMEDWKDITQNKRPLTRLIVVQFLLFVRFHGNEWAGFINQRTSGYCILE